MQTENLLNYFLRFDASGYSIHQNHDSNWGYRSKIYIKKYNMLMIQYLYHKQLVNLLIPSGSPWCSGSVLNIKSVVFQGPSRWEKRPVHLKKLESLEEFKCDVKKYYLEKFLLDGVI